MADVAPTVPRQVVLAVLDAFAQTPVLWRDYVLKGGLPLHLVFGSPRPSQDFDFTSVKPFSSQVTEEKNELLLAFCSLLDDGLARVAPGHGLARMAVTYKKMSEEIPAILARIGYTRKGAPEAASVEMQVTLSEVVCETSRREIEGIPVHVPALDDILAEKLKALLQQVPRRTVRSPDVYDLWYFTTQSPHEVDAAKVARYLQMKSANWDAILPVTRAKFYDAAVREHAAAGYDAVLAELPAGAPAASLDEAFGAVLRFVDGLDLPEA